MKTLTEHLYNSIDNRLGEIIFELDESNRIIYNTKESDLQIGDHAVQREDRPIEAGGNGEHIEEQDIINMFKYAWEDIMDLYYNGWLKPTPENSAFIIQCKCFLNDTNGSLTAAGARPEDKYLWAVFMVQENYRTGKIDVIIKTIFCGAFLHHRHNQERIVIANNGYVKQKMPH